MPRASAKSSSNVDRHLEQRAIVDRISDRVEIRIENASILDQCERAVAYACIIHAFDS
jgi:hypothetical protein